MRRTLLAPLALLVLALALVPAPAAAQAPGWNDARALELVSRAQARRAETQADTGLVDYRADARGYVYFYLDRRDTGERTLVKTDQVALDVLWKAPGRGKQRIVGMRDQKSLPTTIQYHIDHLAVVQDNFGDLIRIGDGDEVRDVLHPAAPGATGFYDFRLQDSTAIRLPGQTEPVRVYEVQVRPRDPARPGLVGSIFVDRRGGDIVRMAFTFTASSYVDRQLDYINISLDNGLWQGRFWLPNRQQVEIRRQLPELGFPAGGMIRGTMHVTNYRFNQGLSDALFRGPPVVAVPEAQRRAFPFERGIHDELREEGGLGPDTELAEVRRQAAELVRARVLSGLPGMRADVPAASAVLRYNRAEGPAVGFGVRRHPDERTVLSLNGGWAFGPMHPTARAGVQRTLPRLRAELSGHWNEARDVGVGPAASGVLNTLSMLAAGRDYTDPFYARGGTLRLDHDLGAGPWSATARAGGEVHRSATRQATFALFGDEGDVRAVRAIDRGTFVGGALSLARAAPAEAATRLRIGIGADGGTLLAEEGDDFTFVRPRVDAGWGRSWTPAAAELEVDLSAGAALGDLPRQGLFLLGGRGTVPGFDFRAFGGDRFALARATASADLWRPFLRARLLGAAGWTDVGPAGERSLALWGARTTSRPRASVGAGLGLAYDILHLDVHRGLGADGRWEVVVETSPGFWDFL